MNTIRLALLRSLANQTQESLPGVVFMHPTLLDPLTQEELVADIAQAAPSERDRLALALRIASRITQALSAGMPYPIGIGPIEAIQTRRDSGELSEDDAAKLVRDAQFLASLSPAYLSTLANAGRLMLFEGKWRESLNLLTLAREATSDLWENPRWQRAASNVALEYIQGVAFALGEVPDGRLHKLASLTGDKLLAFAAKAHDEGLLAEAHRRIGVLHLDPYTANRTTHNFAAVEQAWRYRIVDALGQAAFAKLEKQVALPRTLDALKTAEKHLRKAVDLTAGHDRGLNLKALAQALVFRRFLGGKVAKKRLLEVIDEGLNLIDRDKDGGPWLQMQAWRSFLSGFQPSTPVALRPVNELIAQLGPMEAMNHIISSTNAIGDYAIVLNQLEDARDLFITSGHDRLRSQRWVAMLEVIRYASGFAKTLPKTFAELEACARNDADGESLAQRLAFAAAAAGSWDEERRGLEILDEIEESSTAFAQRNRDLLHYVRATSWIGIAANEFHADRPAEAIEAYGRSLPSLLEIKQSTSIADIVRRIYDLVSKYGDREGLPLSVVKALLPTAVRLEAGDEQIVSLLRRLYRDTLAAMSRHEIDVPALFLLMEMAKGARFSSALLGGFDRDAVSRLAVDPRLSDIAALEKNVRAHEKVNVDSSDPIHERLLVSYVSRDEQQSSATDRGRLDNLQLAFDHDLSSAVLSSVRGQDIYIAPEQVQQQLDGRSVVLIYYLGTTADGKLAIFVVAVTLDQIRFDAIVHPFPESVIGMEFEGRSLRMHPLGLLVNELRNAITRDPDYLVDAEAAATLEKDWRGMFGHLADFLDELAKSGHDRLYIAPHGPLHYYPFHLIGKLGEPLAQHWTVSYLPSLHLLLQPATPKAGGHETVTAIGVGFDDEATKNLGSKLKSRAEAETIAKIFRTEPLLDHDATRARVVPALQSARYVHIATHGQHNVTAPAFQFVQLYPDAGDDGRLFAYEVAALDLSGVELVTLSACETALGRFDEADNLRGLPASLLLAGATTIIGTLWPADDDAAHDFFDDLYRRLRDGNSVSEAFRGAQESTREQHPDYRDWGTFYLVAGLSS